MTDEQVDALIRDAFAELEPRPEVVRALAGPPPRVTWRSEAIAVGLVAVGALALFLPWILGGELPAGPLAAATWAPPSGTRVVQLDVTGAEDGWPEPGTPVDLYAASDGEVAPLLVGVPVAEPARFGALAVAVDPSLAVRAVHGNQTSELVLAAHLPDGRRVVALRDGSPLAVGDVVDVIATEEVDGEPRTWTALRDVEVVYLGREGPLVAVPPAAVAEVIALQRHGRIHLARHLP